MNRFAHRDDEEWCEGPTECVCGVLAEVRADEREKAEHRIFAICPHTKYIGVTPCDHDRSAAAVRGES